MFWSCKGCNIGLCFGAPRVIILLVFWSSMGYTIDLCFGASRVIILDCVLELQGL